VIFFNNLIMTSTVLCLVFGIREYHLSSRENRSDIFLDKQKCNLEIVG